MQIANGIKRNHELQVGAPRISYHLSYLIKIERDALGDDGEKIAKCIIKIILHTNRSSWVSSLRWPTESVSISFPWYARRNPSIALIRELTEYSYLVSNQYLISGHWYQHLILDLLRDSFTIFTIFFPIYLFSGMVSNSKLYLLCKINFGYSMPRFTIVSSQIKYLCLIC